MVEEILAEAAEYVSEIPPDQLQTLKEIFGCYILEVARRTHGGEYRWAEGHDAPVLVTGEPVFHVALLAWDKVRGRQHSLLL